MLTDHSEPRAAFIDLLDPAIAFDPQPLVTLQAMGVRWTRAEPQMIADQIKLEGCTGLPNPLPSFLRVPE